MSTSTVQIPAGGQVSLGLHPPAPSLPRLVRVELRKTYDTRAGVWLLVVVALSTFLVVGLQLFFDDGPNRGYAAYFVTSQLPVSLFLPVLGILLVTSEWSQRTAMTTFALVPHRSRVLTAKVLAATGLALLGVVAAALAAALGTLLTPVLGDTGTSWHIAAAQLGQVAVVQVVTVLVGVAFGMLLLSSPLAIVLYFVLPTAFTALVVTIRALGWLRDWLDLTTTTAPMYEGRLDGSGWLQVATAVALWGIAPMVLGWLRIRRCEIS